MGKTKPQSRPKPGSMRWTAIPGPSQNQARLNLAQRILAELLERAVKTAKGAKHKDAA